jgi:hypothetical protein
MSDRWRQIRIEDYQVFRDDRIAVEARITSAMTIRLFMDSS